MKVVEHPLRQRGDHVKVDQQFCPPFAADPAEIVRQRPSWVRGSVDYLIEWATGERAWVVEWAVHSPAWAAKTGERCPCRQVGTLHRPPPMQV